MKNLKTKIIHPVTGEKTEGNYIEIKNEPSISHNLELEDGTVINFKLIVSRVVRIPNEFDQDDNPYYVIQSNNILSVVHVPENLKK